MGSYLIDHTRLTELDSKYKVDRLYLLNSDAFSIWLQVNRDGQSAGASRAPCAKHFSTSRIPGTELDVSIQKYPATFLPYIQWQFRSRKSCQGQMQNNKNTISGHNLS